MIVRLDDSVSFESNSEYIIQSRGSTIQLQLLLFCFTLVVFSKVIERDETFER